MPKRYLFGPVSPAFAEQSLHGPRQEGNCLAFGVEGKTDVTIEPHDTWGQVCARLPGGWQADFLVLNLPYMSVPACLWSAPVPIVAIALDWPLLWHYYCSRLGACDLVLSDAAGVEVLAREGIAHARAANLYGCDRAFLELSAPTNDEAAHNPSSEVHSTRPGQVRDIDVLFVGNLNPAVQRERLPWLARLAQLGKRWRVAVHAGVFGDAYRRLLCRARIVFDRVGQPRASRRAFEAAAAGALLFADESNTEVTRHFRDRHDSVFYNATNLDGLLEYYLEHEEERHELAKCAQARASQFTFELLWQEVVDGIERAWPDLEGRARNRRTSGKREDLLTRSWQALSGPYRGDPTLVGDLDAALVAEPYSAPLHLALGLALNRVPPNPNAAGAVAEVAAEHFRQAVAHQPNHILARLNLAEALAAAGQKDAAADQAREALTFLARLPEVDAACLDGGYFHADFGVFRIEWEKAAWANAGRPEAEARDKQLLLRWQLHALLARLTGALTHAYEAYLGRPDLSAAALGCALAQKGHPAEALDPLRRALADNPLDADAARAFSHALAQVGDHTARRALIEDRKLLSRAAPQVVPAEAWFSDPQPGPNELASIVILCCNQLEYTRQCFDSVLRWTRPPYELVVVDNASTDETPAFLRQLRTRPGPVRVEVIRNETNVGFPAGCNQAVARARGRYLVLLNNDVVVTDGWLEGLVAKSLHDWPRVGLVGAVTNNAPDAQGVRPGYAALDGLGAYAARRRREYAGRILDVRRLTGFCLLIRREVLDRIGKLDERFGLGFFDDDDLCLRAREAGFRLIVAQDVYVHHYGSRTFKGLGVNSRDQLVANMELFRAKWGAEHLAGYRLLEPWPEPPVPATTDKVVAPTNESATDDRSGPLPSAKSAEENAAIDAAVSDMPAPPMAVADVTMEEVLAATEPPRLGVSLCMIVKNEEGRLPACLQSAGDLFDEVVIVDTGSTDRTKEAAQRFGARVFDFPWCDSFGAARNQCLRYARGKWIMWLDADDRLDADNHRRLHELFETLGEDMAAYAMTVRSVLDAEGRSFRLLDQVRMFPNHPQVRWEYRVHEQTLPAVNRLGGQVRWTDVVIDHVGYQEVGVRRVKLERNLRLMELDDAERPDDPFTLFNLGWTLMDLGRIDEALPKLQRSMERSTPDSSIARKLFHLLTVAHRQLGQKEQARAVCHDGLRRFGDDTELIFESATMALEDKDFPRAEAELLRIVESKPGPYFGSVDDGMRGYKTRDFLGRFYQEHGRATEAEVQWRIAVTEKPTFLPSWLALGETYLHQSRWSDLERAARGAQAAGGAIEAAVLRARGHWGRKEFVPARRVLEEALPQAPGVLGPRVLLSHILLQEDRDPDAAEQALNGVLAIDPGNQEAKHNLEVLRQRHARLAAV